jgi:hypothetical protein
MLTMPNEHVGKMDTHEINKEARKVSLDCTARLWILRMALALVLATIAEPMLAQTRCSALVGKWFGTATRPNGPMLATTFELKGDATFQGTVNANGTPFWVFGGTWECKGGRLTWTYQESSRPLSDAAKVDTDEIVSVDTERLVLRSTSSGQDRSFMRTK